jgi:hypothetical protein
MTVARTAISLDADLVRAVRRAAGKRPTSAWLAEAARQKLRADGLGRVVDDWEREHGALTQAEIDTAARRQAAAVATSGRRSTRRASRPPR